MLRGPRWDRGADKAERSAVPSEEGHRKIKGRRREEACSLRAEGRAACHEDGEGGRSLVGFAGELGLDLQSSEKLLMGVIPS